ncbi:MAG: T9SS type A sorting domain-containing protein [Balneolaceae bacterium]
MLLGLTLFRAEPVRSEAPADSLEISSRFSSSELSPNDEVTLTLSLEDAGDLHFFSGVLGFDSDVVEVIDFKNIGLTDPGIHFDGALNSDQLGFAVSRAGSDPINKTGDFLSATFRVKPLAAGDQIDIIITSTEMSDSQDNDLPFVLGDPPPLTLVPGIGITELTVDSAQEITEGESFTAHGRIYANGVTPDTTKWSDLEVQIGLQQTIGTPGSWTESVWSPATLHTLEETSDPEGIEDDPDAERFAYARADLARRLEPSTYHLAIRSRLDGETGWHYGGVESFEPEGSTTLPTLEVLEQPVYRYALGEWLFSRDQWTPERATVANDSARFYGSNRKPLPDTPERSESGGTDWLQVDGWDRDPVGEVDGEPQKAIQTILSTEGFTNLTLSGLHTGTSAGPAEFLVELSLDGQSWDPLPGGTIDLITESTVRLENLPIPVKYEDQKTLWIRWRQRATGRIDEQDAPISSSSYFRLADIALHGENPEPERIEIHPGDANGDQTVDATDVLTLAHYWRVHGPAPAYDYIEFEQRTVEAWLPRPATHADTNGDGVVDHRDLKAIGLHFGQTVPEDGDGGPGPSGLMESPLVDESSGNHSDSSSNEPLASLTLPPMKQGEERLVYLSTREPLDFKGVAATLKLGDRTFDPDTKNQMTTPSTHSQNIQQATPNSRHPTANRQTPSWSLHLDRLPDGAEVWREESRLLEFAAKDPGNPSRQAVAWSLQGRHESIRDPQLTVLRITATESWEAPRTLHLEQLTLSEEEGALLVPDAIEMSLSESEPPGMGFPDEEEVTLYPNYPNPANSATHIRFYLPEPGKVRLDLFDITGRRVHTPLHGERPAGLHTLTLDASSLASGIYLYRLVSDGEVRTRKMVLIR